MQDHASLLDTAQRREENLQKVPVEDLNISGGLSYLKSKVKGIGLPDGTTTDSRLPQAPRLSGNASISYTLPMGSGDLTARLDGTFTSGSASASYAPQWNAKRRIRRWMRA